MPVTEDDTFAEATLHLPLDGYKAWLERHPTAGIVGYELSKYDSPVGRYLLEAIGTCNQLHSDGKHAWFFLRLTRGNFSDCQLRMVLPDWTAPLAAYYSAFPVGQVSSHPQEKEVSRVQALADLERLVERRHSEAISTGEDLVKEERRQRDVGGSDSRSRRTRKPRIRYGDR